MELYSFDIETTRPINQFESINASITHLTGTIDEGFVVCIRVEPNGIIGRHPTVYNQLFLVVEGEGQVSGSDGVWHDISAGQAAFWSPGESHETRSKTGLTAIVIEGAELQPQSRMKRIDQL